MLDLIETVDRVARSQLNGAFERAIINQAINRDGDSILYIQVVYHPRFDPLDGNRMLAVTNLLADSQVADAGFPVVSFVSSVEAEPGIAAE